MFSSVFFSNFSCEGFNGGRSRLILSYLPVITVIILNPILFLVTYRKGNRYAGLVLELLLKRTIKFVGEKFTNGRYIMNDLFANDVEPSKLYNSTWNDDVSLGLNY